MFDDPWGWAYAGVSFLSGIVGIAPETLLNLAAIGWVARPLGRLVRWTATRGWLATSAVVRWATTTPEMSDTARAALDALDGRVVWRSESSFAAGALMVLTSANGKHLAMLHAIQGDHKMNLEPMLSRREWRTIEAKAVIVLAALKQQTERANRLAALDALTRPVLVGHSL